MALIDQDATIRALAQLHEETGVKTAQAIRVVREMPEADALSSEQITQANDPNTLSALDCVSRQAAIDALKVAYFDEKIQSGKDDPCVIDAMTDWSIRQIKALPSAQSEPRWIPVTERLPLVTYDEHGNHSSEPVILCMESGEIEIGFFNPAGMFESADDDGLSVIGSIHAGTVDYMHVVAWMPFPKPYERSEE